MPDRGGELTEGIIAINNEEVDNKIQNLIGVGLVRFNELSQIIPGVANKYEISPDGKRYKFEINNKYDPDQVIEQLKNPEASTSQLEISREDSNIIINLSAPFGPLITDLTDPIITPGPYFVKKRDKAQIMLESNPDFIFGNPYISKITIKVYPDKDALMLALKRGELLAALDIDSSYKGFNNHQLNLPRYQMLFFNLDREPWNNIENRKKFIQKQKFDNPIDLEITTTKGERQEAILENLKKEYQDKNVIIKDKIIDDGTFENEILPNREYQSLLYGINFGRDPDPYAFWHSSQIGPQGQNLSKLSNSKIDKILEDTRLISDLEKRKVAYVELANKINEFYPAVTIEQRKINYLASSKINGIIIDQGVSFGDRFYNVWQWYIRTKKEAK